MTVIIHCQVTLIAYMYVHYSLHVHVHVIPCNLMLVGAGWVLVYADGQDEMKPERCGWRERNGDPPIPHNTVCGNQ